MRFWRRKSGKEPPGGEGQPSSTPSRPQVSREEEFKRGVKLMALLSEHKYKSLPDDLNSYGTKFSVLLKPDTSFEARCAIGELLITIFNSAGIATPEGTKTGKIENSMQFLEIELVTAENFNKAMALQKRYFGAVSERKGEPPPRT